MRRRGEKEKEGKGGKIRSMKEREEKRRGTRRREESGGEEGGGDTGTRPKRVSGRMAMYSHGVLATYVIETREQRGGEGVGKEGGGGVRYRARCKGRGEMGAHIGQGGGEERGRARSRGRGPHRAGTRVGGR